MSPIRFPQARSNASANFQWLSWAPSYRAPSAQSVLKPPPFQPPQAPLLPAEEARLLRCLLDHPDDDAPRLAMADWYQAANPERANFIRAQIAGKVVTPNPKWADIFEPWCAQDLVYVRGFVESMSLSGRAFLKLGAPLFEMTPLRHVRLVAIAPYFYELLACPHLSELQSLDLRGNNIPPEQIDALRARGLRVE